MQWLLKTKFIHQSKPILNQSEVTSFNKKIYDYCELKVLQLVHAYIQKQHSIDAISPNLSLLPTLQVTQKE